MILNSPVLIKSPLSTLPIVFDIFDLLLISYMEIFIGSIVPFFISNFKSDKPHTEKNNAENRANLFIWIEIQKNNFEIVEVQII